MSRLRLLDGRSGFFIADPDVVWPGRGGGGLIEQVAEIQVERLGGGTARLGFDVLGDRGVPGRRRVLDDAHSIRRIEDDLAVQAANARQGVRNRFIGHGEQHDVCVGGVPAVSPEFDHFVPRPSTAVRAFPRSCLFRLS